MINFAAKNTGTQPCLVKSISASVVSAIGPVSSSNGACQTVIRGGDHALTSFPEHVPDIVEWAASGGAA